MKTKIRSLVSRAERLSRAEAKNLNKQLIVDFKSNEDLLGFIDSANVAIVNTYSNVLMLGAAVGVKSLKKEGLQLSLEDRMIRELGEEEYEAQRMYFAEMARVLTGDVRTDIGELFFKVSTVVRQEALDEKVASQVIRQALVAKGYSPLTARNLKTVFTTGFHLAYNGVRFARTINSPDVWGYRYQTAGDEDVREAHVQQQGTTLPKDDPFWRTWWPPAGYNCRCTTDILFEEEKVVEPDRTIMPDPGFENLFMDLRGF